MLSPLSTADEPQDWPTEQTYDSMDTVKDRNFQTMSGTPAKYTLHTSNNKFLIQAHEDSVIGIEYFEESSKPEIGEVREFGADVEEQCS